MQRFYEDCRACIRVEMDVSEWAPVNGGLRQGCVMLFNCCLMREVTARMFGKWLELLSGNGGRFYINQLLYADTALASAWLTQSRSCVDW